MKNLLIISFLLVGFIVNGCVNQSVKSCSDDAECIKSVDGCCPCNMGGQEIAEYAKYDKIAKDCKNVVCPAINLCTEKKAKCLNSECILQ